MNSLFSRAAVVLVFAALLLMALQEQKKPEAPAPEATAYDEPAREAVKPPAGGYKNSMALAGYWAGVLALGGVIVFKWLLPAITDKVEEKVAPAPGPGEVNHAAKARALAVQGDYGGAIASWARLAQENPGDPAPMLEIAGIHAERLEDPDAAIQVLETAAAGEWGADQRAAITLKMATIYQEAKGDTATARGLLEGVISSAPGSPAASEAHQRIQEIEEQEFLASRNQGA